MNETAIANLSVSITRAISISCIEHGPSTTIADRFYGWVARRTSVFRRPRVTCAVP